MLELMCSSVVNGEQRKSKMKTVNQVPFPLSLIHEIEQGVCRRLNRHVTVEHLNDTTLEQLLYLVRHESDDYLTRSLNEALDL